MVYLKFIRYRTDEQFITDAMCVYNFASYPERCVAVASARAFPKPAVMCTANLGEEVIELSLR